jgi:hypothetical protein
MSPGKKVKAVKHAVKKASKARKRKKAATPRVRGPDDDFTVAEFCARHRISKVHFYGLLKLGVGPKTMKLGKSRRITLAADADWAREREAQTKTMVAAAA